MDNDGKLIMTSIPFKFVTQKTTPQETLEIKEGEWVVLQENGDVDIWDRDEVDSCIDSYEKNELVVLHVTLIT